VFGTAQLWRVVQSMLASTQKTARHSTVGAMVTIASMIGLQQYVPQRCGHVQEQSMNGHILREHRDVIIIGAGISGLGAACHLQRECPTKEYLILEARDAIGGTWDLFRYPGIRSDSDLYTYAYDFKPWYGPPIATAAEILQYLHEVVAEYTLEPHLRFGHRVGGATWSTSDALWTIAATNRAGESCFFTCNFLIMCQGYCDCSQGRGTWASACAAPHASAYWRS